MAWDDGIGIGIADADNEPILIAEVVDGGDMADPARLLADQRLIAAAPDMLAVLEAFELYASGYAGSLPDLRDQARATIAKAKGEV